MKLKQSTILNQFNEFIEFAHIKCGREIREEIATEQDVAKLLDLLFEDALRFDDRNKKI